VKRFLNFKFAFCVWATIVLAVAVVVAALPDKKPEKKKGFRIELAANLGATGVYVTTVTKGAYQSPSSVQFQQLTKSFTSSAASILDQNVSSGSATAVLLSGGTGAMQMLYGYSTTLDGTLSQFNNTAGTGAAAASVLVTAGIPYEWDSATSGTAALGLVSGSNSITFSAGTTYGGVGTSNTTTAFNAAALYP